jgi:hypothetical protein
MNVILFYSHTRETEQKHKKEWNEMLFEKLMKQHKETQE